MPYISEREIPAVKAALSAWRKLRRDKTGCKALRFQVSRCADLPAHAEYISTSIAVRLETLAAIEERMTDPNPNKDNNQ